MPFSSTTQTAIPNITVVRPLRVAKLAFPRKALHHPKATSTEVEIADSSNGDSISHC